MKKRKNIVNNSLKLVSLVLFLEIGDQRYSRDFCKEAGEIWAADRAPEHGVLI